MLEGLVYAVVVGLIAGWLAGYILKGRGFNLLGNLIVGLIGSLLGSFLASVLGLHWAGLLGNILVATGGAIVLLMLLPYIRR